MLAAALALLFALAAPQERSSDFWSAIPPADYAVPAGESAAALLAELDGLLASRDSVLRDDLGYGIASQWIYRQRLLTPEELRVLTRTWTGWLGRGMAEPDGDPVLLRSFTALDLSLLAALDLEAPFLDEQGFDALLDATLDYLVSERDLRGWVAGIGWVHATAHTADLLKFLARNAQLDAGDQARLLEAIAQRMATTDSVIFTHGEDDRLAAAVISILGREDFDPDAFSAFLELCLEPARSAPRNNEFDPVRYAAQHNSQALLSAVHERLSLAGELPPHLDEALEALRASLRTARGR